jgi:SAM-dependent methyltransferase
VDGLRPRDDRERAMTRLVDSPWDAPSVVAGFERGVPNDVLMRFASAERRRAPNGLAIDIGCGAARNSVPLAEQGWRVLGTDLSAPMLAAAARRVAATQQADHVHLALAGMDTLPVRTGSADLIVAQGIWNLARSAAEFRAAVAEAARISRPGAGLFVFTFSRHTLPDDAEPVPGESFVFTQFSGRPQCFLTDTELVTELEAVGFVPDSSIPFSEYNRRPSIGLSGGGPPVIYEAAFRFAAGPRSGARRSAP